MVRPASQERLRQALSELHAAKWDGARPSMAKVCERAGVTRATAYRCEEFVDEYHRVLNSAKTKPKRGGGDGRPSKQQDTVLSLRASVDRLANLVQHLSLANQQQRVELDRFRAAAPPPAEGDRKVPSRRGTGRARRATPHS